MRLTQALAAVAILACLHMAIPLRAAELAPTDWSQWRGQRRDGHLAEPASWPDALSGEALSQVWRVPLGQSYSGPLVVGERVFVTATVEGAEEKDEIVQALDRQSGEVLWERRWPGSLSVPFFAWANGSWIRCTPAWDEGRLFVGGMRDVLVCLDEAQGSEIWRVDFGEKFKTPLPAFGFVSSPVVVGPHLYVQAGGAVVKLDKATGAVLWRTLEDEGGMEGSAFSSPLVTTLGGREQVVVQTRTQLAGVDPRDGGVLWSQEIPAFRGMNILTPTAWRDSLFTSSYGGKSLGFQLIPQGDALQLTEAWVNSQQGYMSSPVVIGGQAYLHLRNQRFCCIDLASGVTRWITTPFGQYWSLVANGDKILALDERGELLLIQANPEKFELLDRRKVSESPTWAHLAVSGEEVFVRELEALAVYRWSAAGSRPAATATQAEEP